MITQTIKRWLDRLFVWWPWRKSSKAGYTQAVGNLNKGTMPVWRTPKDGPMPLPGTTSVAIEHVEDVIMPEVNRPISGERSERIVQPQSEEITHLFYAPSSPTAEQHLVFLRYLVQRGIINEGFEEDQIPEQYKQH